MLKTHFAAVEEYLLALKKIGENTGHSLHKGDPREAFIHEFLKGHLSEKVSIGRGEIIDKDSLPGQRRNQQDIVIFKSEYPRIDFGGGVRGFLAESVIATIEVKSTLTEEELRSAIKAAKNTKELNISRGASIRVGSDWEPPAPLSFVVAYEGPAKMATVHGWIEKIYQSEEITYPTMGETIKERQKIPSPATDGIFILGKGFIQFDNFPISFIQDTARAEEKNKDKKWSVIDIERGSLLMLFSILTQAVSVASFSTLDATPYLSTFNIQQENLNFM